MSCYYMNKYNIIIPTGHGATIIVIISNHNYDSKKKKNCKLQLRYYRLIIVINLVNTFNKLKISVVKYKRCKKLLKMFKYHKS